MLKKKVLLVEDDHADIDLVKHFFKKNFPSLDLTCVDTGREALKELAEKEYDLLIIDVMLPDMTGFDVIKQIQILRVPDIIIVSGRDDKETLTKAQLLDVAAYVVKPLDADFASLIGTILIDYQ